MGKMKDLLFHVSDKIYKVLLPKKSDNHEECICLSENCFISYFGRYLYIFDKQVLYDNFHIKEISTAGLDGFMSYQELEFRFRSIPLGTEYRIYQPINIDKFCLGIAEHFNHLKGELNERMMNYCLKQEKEKTIKVDFSLEER